METLLQPEQMLLAHFQERQSINRSYSLRAFARDLKLSPQQLSNVLNGNRKLTYATAVKISDALALPANEHVRFVESVRALYSKHETVRQAARERLKNLKAVEPKDQNLSLDLFKTISNWFHLALVELIKIEPRKKISWYAKRLKISENETQLAFNRLLKLELIEKTTTGFKTLQDTVLVDRGIPTDAIRNFHQQILNQALQSLAEAKTSERYGSSSVIAVRKKDLGFAKKRIQEFRIELARELAARGKPDEIFALSIQYFQVSESENYENKHQPKENKI